MKTASLMKYLSVIKDIHQTWKVRHKLTETSFKSRIKRKQKNAATMENYLARALAT